MADFTNKPSTSKCDQSGPSAAPLYELTAGNGGSVMTNGTVPMAKPAPHGHKQPMQNPQCSHTDHRKRKMAYYSAASSCDDDLDDSKSSRSVSEKKQNHSEIEKRRRNKMNTYISELSTLVPMCGAMSRKLDKLTVLRMAIQHLRTIRGALSVCPLTARPRPTFLSEQEVNSLILCAAHDSFLLVVGCDRGRLLYVSASVTKMLNYEQSELLGQNFFDILHPKDVAKVKEQLSSPDLSPRERLIDAQTMLPVKADMATAATRLSPGARRSFFCRIKCKLNPIAQTTTEETVKAESNSVAKIRKKQNEKKYRIIQCTGYLKSWDPAELGEVAGTFETNEDGDSCSLSCLVAVGRAMPDIGPATYSCSTPPTTAFQYVSRHAPDGKFTFVDQRVTLALGFLPQELLGTSLYEYITGPELAAVTRAHKAALMQLDSLFTPPYLFRKKDGTYIRIQTHFKPFKNPWTKEIEFLVANNSIVTDAQVQYFNATTQSQCDMYNQIDTNTMNTFLREIDGCCNMDLVHGIGLTEADAEIQRLIESQVESHKIGSAIAEEALGRTSIEFSPELPIEILQDVVFNPQASLVDNILGMDIDYCEVRNNVPLSAAGEASTPPPAGSGDIYTGTPTPAVSPPLPVLGLDGNSEAAMAVIMNFLEADAGLGHPIDDSWNLQ